MSAGLADLPASSVRQSVEFYTIELAHLADGAIYVSVTATTVDEQEPQLLNQEIARDRVATIEDALAIIKAVVLSSYDCS